METMLKIHMRNGQYEPCKQVATSAGARDSLDRNDVRVMWHENRGEFIAVQSMGTWCEANAWDILEVIS